MKYLVTLKNKKDVEFLQAYGTVAHVAKLTNLIVLESDDDIIPVLSVHDNVASVRKSDILRLV